MKNLKDTPKGVKVGCLSMVVLFVFLSVIGTCSEQINLPVGNTDYELAEAFNKKAAKRNLPYRAGIKDRQESVSEFSVSDTDWAVFLGIKTGEKIDSVLFVGGSDGSTQSGVDQVVVLSLLIEAIDDSISDKKRTDLIDHLALAVEKPGVSIKREISPFSYTSVYRDGTGWWVTID
ncbi:MAG: hypothetical protein AB7E95_06350 [Kiritimatiellales bacterium]